MRLATIVVMTVLSAGCFNFAPKPWDGVFLKQAEVNRLQGGPSVFIAPANLAGLRVNEQPLDGFKATLSDKKLASFETDLVAFAEKFAERTRGPQHFAVAPALLADDAATAAYVAAVTLESLHLPGGTVATYLVEIRDAGGHPIESYRRVMKSPSGYGSGDEIRALGILIGAEAAQFIRARAQGKTQP